MLYLPLKPTLAGRLEHSILYTSLVIQFLLCLTLAGCSSKEDTVTSSRSQAPTIVSETSVSMLGPKSVIVTAAINANDQSTEYYFEYGQTTSYGKHTVSKSIGSGGNIVLVMDTIRGLPWDTTYHSRVVAENAAGKTSGSDRSFICSSAGWTEFVFPLAAGTTWQYTYQYYSSYAGSINIKEIRGTQTWQSTGLEVGDSIRINVTKVDTTSFRMWSSSDPTITVSVTNTSFFVVVTPDSFDVQCYHVGVGIWPTLCMIPRWVKSNTDSLTIDLGNGTANYVTGKGLTSWVYSRGMNYPTSERLILESVSP
jgi:hypothetical protein